MSTVPASLRSYRFDLVEAIDRELAHGHTKRHVRRRHLYVGVAVAAAALLLLVFAEPWQGNPTILDRAQAALLAPAGGQILYESVTVRRVPAKSTGSVRHVRLWLDSATHRFRMTFSGLHPAEVGGIVGSSAGLNYIPSANALYRAAFQFRVNQADLDPAAFVRSALRSGRAKILGKATVRGHEVIRIKFSGWFMTSIARRLEPIAIYYVDANTYRPVRVVTPPPYGRVSMSDTVRVRTDWSSFQKTGVTYPEHAGFGFPMDPSAFLVGFPGTSTRSFPVIRGYTTVSAPRPHLVYDFDEYGLLPATAANRRLTSVRAVRDNIAAYAAGFRAASTPAFKALRYYGTSCLAITSAQQLPACGRSVGRVGATLPRLLRFVTSHTPPASSLPSTSVDVRQLAVSIHGLQRQLATLAALIRANDLTRVMRMVWLGRMGSGLTMGPYPADRGVGALLRAVFDLQADIPGLTLRL